MREITITIDDRKVVLPAFSTAKEALEKAGIISGGVVAYEDNPVVGVLVNGELSPLGAPVPMSCTVEPVRAFQGFGRRIYRHSICYLLCYASRLVFPRVSRTQSCFCAP